MTYHKTRTLFGAKITAVLMIMAFLAVLLLAGCGAKRTPDTAADEPAAPAVTEQPTEEAIAITTTAPDTAAVQSTESPTVTEDQAAPDEPEIIAESSNTVSDKEKQQILDDLTSELGKALDTLGSLDEPDASDMDADSIE